jgi:hypothetical protein
MAASSTPNLKPLIVLAMIIFLSLFKGNRRDNVRVPLTVFPAALSSPEQVPKNLLYTD